MHKSRIVIALFAFLLVCTIQPASAKQNWPLTVKVMSTQNIADEHGAFHLSWGGGSGGSGWAHRVREHAFVEASDGNNYELQPQNMKDMLLPGSYQAKIEKRDMKICEPKDNGNCREVKFVILAASPTANAAKAVLQPISTQAVTSSNVTKATLSVDSTPTEADIEIDGAFVGNTPSMLSVDLGSHQIVVKKKGFTDWAKTLVVTAGTIHVRAELDQKATQQ